MTDAEKEELIEIKHRVRGALAGFKAIVESYEAFDNRDDYIEGKLAAYRIAVDRLSDITEK